MRATEGTIEMNGLRWVVAAGALCLASTAQAIEFSAESVAHNSRGQTRMEKIFVSNGQVRVEPADAPSYELLDTVKKTGYFVVPTKKWAVVLPAVVAARNAAPYKVGANPCASLAGTGGFATCKKLGSDTVNGRPTEKWQVTQTGPGGTDGLGESFTSTVWLDRGLDVIVKAVSARGTLAVQNLHMGPQPANLFALPAGYTMKNLQDVLPQQAPAQPAPAHQTAPQQVAPQHN